MAIGSRCMLTDQGKDGGSAVELALLGLHRGWRRAKLGGAAALALLALLSLCTLVFEGVGGSALVRELAALLGRWQWCVGVGTLLRQAADASVGAPCLCPRVKVGGGGSSACFSCVSMGGAGQTWGRAAALALLALLGLCWWAIAGR
jgi:hypothetical protein